MNTIWSTYLQGIDTLYSTRSLRFADAFREKYARAFGIEDGTRILEIGCGPGALSQSLKRWYPQSKITGIDRDSAFIRFAAENAHDVHFMEADATALPFANAAFDVAISNTVQEHIEPSKFFSEQYRVLKEGGVCLVLSARRGISVPAPCVAAISDFEKEIWARTEAQYRENDQKYNVGAYSMSESALPAAMQQYGFRDVSTEYITINLTPDNPSVSREMAHAMINANRAVNLDAVNGLPKIAPGSVSDVKLAEMCRRINTRYDERLALYDSGVPQWDVSMSLTMVLRGVK